MIKTLPVHENDQLCGLRFPGNVCGVKILSRIESVKGCLNRVA